MISVETSRPVFSNAGGKTADQKKEARAKAWEKAKTGYTKAKESGLLQGIENLVLQNKGTSGGSTGTFDVPPPPPPAKEPMSMGMKIGIGVGVVAIGFAIYWFAIRKK